MVDADQALAELVRRFDFHVEAALTIYGQDHEDTPAAVQAFRHAIRLTERYREELAKEAPSVET